MEEPAQPAIEALRERRVRYHPESQHRFAIASLEESARLVPVAPALVGAPAPDLDDAGRRGDLRGHRGGGAGARRRRGAADPRPGRPRHVVLVGALAVRDARLAGRDARARGATTPGNVNSTAREIIRLWENRMIWAGLEVMGEVPFTDVIIHSTVLAAGRAADVEEPRHRDRPARDDRRARRRCDALRAAQDLVDPGRALLARRDRGGAQAREQALERLAPDPPERGRGRARRSSRRRSRSAGSSPGSTTRGRRSRRPGARFDFATATNVLYHLTFDDFCDWYAEAIKPRLYEHEPAACATALAALERLLALLHPVMPHVTEEIWSHLPGSRGAPDRVGVARRRTAATRGRSTRSSACRRRR